MDGWNERRRVNAMDSRKTDVEYFVDSNYEEVRNGVASFDLGR